MFPETITNHNVKCKDQDQESKQGSLSLFHCDLRMGWESGMMAVGVATKDQFPRPRLLCYDAAPRLT